MSLKSRKKNSYRLGSPEFLVLTITFMLDPFMKRLEFILLFMRRREFIPLKGQLPVRKLRSRSPDSFPRPHCRPGASLRKEFS